jgi:hypothetical protein
MALDPTTDGCRDEVPEEVSGQYSPHRRTSTPATPLQMYVLVTPTPTVESEEEYSSVDEDDSAWRRDEEGRGPHFAEDVQLTSTPWPRSVDYVHDEKVTDARPSGGKSTPLPRVAGPDPVTEGPMHEMLREMKQWRESQDRPSQTLLAKLSDSADRGVTVSHGNSEETTPRHAKRSTETSLARQDIENSTDRHVREESTLARKSPPSRRKGKDSPSVSVSGVMTRQPRGDEENPPPKRKSKGRAVTYAPETFRGRSRAEYSGVDTTPWSEEENVFVKKA